MEKTRRHPRLPKKLLIEILSRIPVKTLIRFTCVCKSWSDLIKSPDFSTHQILVSRSNLHHDHLLLHHLGLSSFTLVSHSDLDPATAFECKPYQEVDYKGQIAGPCNGIFCVKLACTDSYSILILWNPATRERRVLPGGPRILGDFGIGFDRETGDYKVVHGYVGQGYGGLLPVGEVFSLLTDSWRRIDMSNFVIGGWSRAHSSFDIDIVPGVPISNGGFCNWMSGNCKYLPRSPSYLLSFDVKGEMFLKTMLPVGYKAYCLVKLQPDEAKACVVCSPIGFREPLDVWVLEEYGVKESWTRRWSVEFPDDYCVYDISCLVGMWKEEELLFRHGLGLVSYNIVSKCIRSTGVRGWRLNSCMIYNESLVSVQGVVDPRGLVEGEEEEEEMDAQGRFDFCKYITEEVDMDVEGGRGVLMTAT
ncbi:hypothetical protein Dimus_001420 [Dionaea muscipula]